MPILAILGCAGQTQPEQIDAVAFRLIDFSQLAPPVEAVLKQAINRSVCGQPSSEFAEALGLADRTTDGPRGTAYEFFLPLSTQALQELFDDELVHRPELTVIVDPESGMIVRCIVDEIRF
jgi:hypothetical protein